MTAAGEREQVSPWAGHRSGGSMARSTNSKAWRVLVGRRRVTSLVLAAAEVMLPTAESEGARSVAKTIPR